MVRDGQSSTRRYFEISQSHMTRSKSRLLQSASQEEEADVCRQDLYLPEELLNQIVQYFDPELLKDPRENFQTLARLSRASKQLHRLAEPLLYGSFPGHRHVNALSWLMAIVARPGRALGVRNVTVHEYVRWRSGKRREKTCIKESEEPLAAWALGLGQDEVDAFTASKDNGRNKNKNTDGEEEREEEGNSTTTLGGEEHDSANESLDDGFAAYAEGDSDPDLDEYVLQRRNRLNLSRYQDSQKPSEQSMAALDESNDFRTLIAIGVMHGARNVPILLYQLGKMSGKACLDTVMSIIVLVCPNLTTLDIELCDGFHDSLLSEVLNSHSGGTISHVKLRRQNDEDRTSCGVGGLAEMIERRRVETLELTLDNLEFLGLFGECTYAAYLWCEGRDIYKDHELVPDWSNMKSITITDCGFPSSESPCPIDWMLRACPNLVSLELKSVNGERLLLLDVWGKAIRQHGQKLQRLVIDAGTSWHKQEYFLAEQLEVDGLWGVGRLHELTNLKELIATPWTILSSEEAERADDDSNGEGFHHFVDHLPPTLQCLTILPCITRYLAIDVEEEIGLLRMDPAFKDLKIRVVECELEPESDGTASEEPSDDEFEEGPTR